MSKFSQWRPLAVGPPLGALQIPQQAPVAAAAGFLVHRMPWNRYREQLQSRNRDLITTAFPSAFDPYRFGWSHLSSLAKSEWRKLQLRTDSGQRRYITYSLLDSEALAPSFHLTSFFLSYISVCWLLGHSFLSTQMWCTGGRVKCLPYKHEELSSILAPM